MNKSIHATCSACGAAREVPAWSLVNVREEPQLKEKVRDGSLFLWECPHCGRTNLARYPLVYHDPDARLMVWMMPDGVLPPAQMDLLEKQLTAQEDALEGYTLRRVEDVGSLMEKVAVADAGLDDRVVELCKYVMRMEEDGKPSGNLPPEGAVLRFYRMEGVVINDPAKIGAMDAAVDGTDQAESIVIPVKYNPKKECYEKASGGTLLETEEFRELMEVTNQQVSRICGEMLRGEIDAVPKRETKKDRDGNRISACRFCGYQSICSFDPAIRGCRYEDV